MDSAILHSTEGAGTFRGAAGQASRPNLARKLFQMRRRNFTSSLGLLVAGWCIQFSFATLFWHAPIRRMISSCGKDWRLKPLDRNLAPDRSEEHTSELQSH